MREIKFRAKIIRAGKWSKWIYGSLDFNKYTYQEARIVGYDDPVQYWHKIDKNTIGQYTGLKDKNEKEIYEGDIVLYEDWEMATENGSGDSFINKGIIIYNESNCCFDVTEKMTIEREDVLYEKNDTLEVIGNIYDNKEILEY